MRGLDGVDGVLGWFPVLDEMLFDWILASGWQPLGDLLEIGAYLGRTAIPMGRHLRPSERLVVCDLFGARASSVANQREMEDYRHYGHDVTVEVFLSNYRRYHDIDPVVLRMDSASLRGSIDANSVRFAHVDASHLYMSVRSDIEASCHALGPLGIIAIDDYRGRRTPGVAAATWEAVACSGLRPLWLTEQKFYGTWDAQLDLSRELGTLVQRSGCIGAEVQEVAGFSVTLLSDLVLAAQRVSASSMRNWPIRGNFFDLSCR